jgi:hypothetical protein
VLLGVRLRLDRETLEMQLTRPDWHQMTRVEGYLDLAVSSFKPALENFVHEITARGSRKAAVACVTFSQWVFIAVNVAGDVNVISPSTRGRI